MTPPPPVDDRVRAALEAYLAEREAGAAPSRSVFLARHPDVTRPLGEALDALAVVRVRPATTDPDDLLLQSVGEFHLLGVAGRGGMGVVYKALQLDPGRPVALKVMDPGLRDSPAARERFRREADTAGRLHHTNVVPVFATVTDAGGLDAYAMPLIHGLSLAAVVRGVREGFPAGVPDGFAGLAAKFNTDRAGYGREVAEWVRQAAEALAAAHDAGVVHRDVKPANLLLEYTRAGRPHVWLHDFGLAYTAGADDAWADGVVLGTAGYLSPEQAAGDPAHRDPRTDVFALGVALFELLALRRPTAADLGAGRRRAADIPAELGRVISRATAAGPADRYSSAGEFAEDLTRYLAGFPVRAGRPGWRRHAAKWAARHRRSLGAAGAAFAVAAGSGYAAERAARRQAEHREGLAVAAVNTYSPVVDDTLYAMPGMATRQVTLLDQARRVNEELLAARPADRKLQWQVAQVSWRLGRGLARADRLPEATAAYERSVALFTGLAAAEPAEPLHRLDLARTISHQLDPAAVGRAVAVVRTAAADFPADARVRGALSAYLGDLARQHLMRGDHPAAEPLLREAMVAADGYAAADPGRWQHRHTGVRTRMLLAEAVGGQGSRAEAVELNTAAERTVLGLLARDEADPTSPRPLDRMTFRSDRVHLLHARCRWRPAGGADFRADVVALTAAVQEFRTRYPDREHLVAEAVADLPRLRAASGL